ncbi:MAG: beta-ketoacyl-[acyl-carrier-protein] synthase family protein [Gammaproteobacteria bacterium]|nr:beta-ketoacyl-[acyl-carrier-protein] synthase family protein [Gammaproteobacteria bacterium]
MFPLVITAFTTTSALGRGAEAMRSALQARQTGLAPCTFDTRARTYTGAVDGVDDVHLPEALAVFNCRNNRLAQLGLEQDGFMDSVRSVRERYGARRVGVILGTSTAGIHETEIAYNHLDPVSGKLPAEYHFETTHNLFATSQFVRRYLDLQGPAAMVSTACSSSAKVFASAWRLIAAGEVDAVVVGGVDSLCYNTLHGFGSLGLVSETPTRPCAPDRSGISIGEAAGFAIVERAGSVGNHTGLALYGYGESSDAYHMSTPRPDGAGAALAMERALSCADLKPDAIGYVNMHGTASEVNDAMEDKAISRVLGTNTPASSTKGWTGHTLGAAGITEAAISFIALKNGFLPGTLNTQQVDPTFTSRIILENESAEVSYILSNSFGFGGSNCSLIFGMHE